MAQTTDQISWRDAELHVSTDDFSASDVDISGSSNEITLSGGERDTGQMKTMDGDFPLVTTGKRNLLTVELTCVYTDNAGEAYALAKAAYENATQLDARWWPIGNTTGNAQFTTDGGLVVTPPYPVGSSESADPVAFMLRIQCKRVVEADAA